MELAPKTRWPWVELDWARRLVGRSTSLKLGALLFGHKGIDPDHLGRPRDGLRDAAQGVNGYLMPHQRRAYRRLAQASFPRQVRGMPASADQLAAQPVAVNGDAHHRHLPGWPPKRES
jgi:hypothetical protein